MDKRKILITIVYLNTAFAVTAAYCAASNPQDVKAEHGRLVCDVYPWLATGSLTYARLAELPAGIVLRSSGLIIKEGQVAEQVTSAPKQVRGQLRRNSFYVLENMATRQLLIQVAKASMADQTEKTDERQILDGFIKGIVSSVDVTEEDVVRFYQDNKDAIGGVPLGQVKDQIRQLVLQERQQVKLKEYILTLGQRIPIDVSASWVKAQSVLALDNPVDKARSSGMPSLVNFGSTGCVPCQMMAPILERLKTEYIGRLNVVFVHVDEEQVLAARYQIEAIPTQIFYDKNGKEVSRHVGFLSEEQIGQRLKQIGVN